MPYYKDKKHALHFLDDETFEHVLPEGSIKITDLDAETIQNPPLTLDQAKAFKLASLAAYRYEKEIGGIECNGISVKTDRESQSMLNGAITFFNWNPEAIINWKGTNGWVQVNRATLENVAKTVGAHVQTCFSQEKTHAEAIEALVTKEEVEAYDFTTSWPI